MIQLLIQQNLKSQGVDIYKMSVNNNLNMEKAKLMFRLPVSKILSSQDIFQEKQKKVCEITFRSIRNSNLKLKTLNYKEYELQRRTQLQKRHVVEKSLSLYLDGVNPSTQRSLTFNKNILSSQIYNRDQQPSGLVSKLRYSVNNPKQFLSARKSLKKMILDQIRLKNQEVKQLNKSNQLKITQCVDMENPFVYLKKSKPNYQRNRSEVSRKEKQTFALRNNSVNLNLNSEKQTNMPPKNSVFSQRKFERRKNKSQSKAHLKNSQSQLFKAYLPSLDQKGYLKNIITFDSNQVKMLRSESYIVLSFTENKILSGKQFKKNAQIASLTKIMTFYTILCICKEYSIDYSNRIIEISERMEQMSGTSAQILTGQKYTLEQLLYGLMLPSGNDAALAIASEGGSILKVNQNKSMNSNKQNVKSFVKYMNVLAKRIGMKDTTFANPHGLPNSQNRSNALELSILISNCLRFPQFIKITGTQSISFWIEGKKSKREVFWENTHKLLRRPGFIGGKTGVTITAGPCLATVYKSKQGQILIVVVLRAPKLSRRFKQTRWILGSTLKKLDANKYNKDVKQIMKENPQLDSDNSEDEQMFDFKRSDSEQMRKRVRILVNEM